MILKRVSVLLFAFIVFLFINPIVSATGDFTVDIYEIEREVIFSENQASQTIYMDGAVNYSGVSAYGDNIELLCSSDLGESSVTPTQVTFHQTGSQEFTVAIVIPNAYENGTTGGLEVRGTLRQGGITKTTIDYANIVIINHSHTDNDNNNLNNSENNRSDGSLTTIGGILMISIIIIAIIVAVIKKKILK